MKPDCRETQEKVYQYLDGEMGVLRRWRVRRHLRRCPPCGDGFTFESHLKQRVREGCMEEVPPELLSRISSFLRQNGGTDPSAGPTAGGSDV
jgi:mycothiol system anti-sigma-R factor